MCSGTAYGQYIFCSIAWSMVGCCDRFCGKPASQSLWTRKLSCFSGKHDRRVLLWYCLLFLPKDQSDLYSRSTWYRIFRWTCGCSCCKVAYADSGRRSFCLCDPVLYLYVCRQYFIICNIFCLKKEWKPHTITGNGT